MKTVLLWFHRSLGLLASAFLAAALFAGSAQAQERIYTYTGNVLTEIVSFSAGDCTPVGGCVAYSGSTTISGFFRTSAPLPASSVNYVVPFAQITQYSFSDGYNTLNKANLGARLMGVVVNTNGSGDITSATFSLIVWRDGLVSGHSGIPPNSTASNGRYNFIEIEPGGDVAFTGRRCTGAGTSGGGVADTCLNSDVDTYTSGASSAGTGAWITSIPPTIPTLSEWAMLALALMIVGFGSAYLNRSRPTTGA